MSTENLLVFSGNANRKLAQAVCSQLGVPMGKALVGKKRNDEVSVQLPNGKARKLKITKIEVA